MVSFRKAEDFLMYAERTSFEKKILGVAQFENLSDFNFVNFTGLSNF